MTTHEMLSGPQPTRQKPWNSFWQALLMGGVGGMLLSKVLMGTLPLYVHSRYTPLIAATGGLLVLLALYQAWSAFQPTTHDHDHDHDHDHGHDHAPRDWRSPALLALLIPIALGILVPSRALGSAAIDSKGFGTGASGIRSIESLAGNEAMVNGLPDTSQWDMLDWVNGLVYQPDNPRLQGQPIEMIGFVWRRPEMPGEQFILSRFVVSCCAADGLAVGLPVVYQGAGDLPTDSWVRVKGVVGLTSVLGEQEAAIMADEIATIPQPAEPYLYP